MSVGPGTDYEGRGLWLGLAVAVVFALGGGAPGFSFFGDRDLQIWLFVASRIALGLSLVLGFLLVVPEVRRRLGQQFRSERTVFAWAFGFLVLAILISVVAAVEGAINSLDEDFPPFS